MVFLFQFSPVYIIKFFYKELPTRSKLERPPNATIHYRLPNRFQWPLGDGTARFGNLFSKPLSILLRIWFFYSSSSSLVTMSAFLHDWPVQNPNALKPIQAMLLAVAHSVASLFAIAWNEMEYGLGSCFIFHCYRSEHFCIKFSTLVFQIHLDLLTSWSHNNIQHSALMAIK